MKGTATAASLWVTGAIGAAVGLGSYDVAVMLALFTMITLWLLSPLKREVEQDAPGEPAIEAEPQPQEPYDR